MKVGVFFGSTSDQRVATKLLNSLAEAGFDPELHFISAHRNADELVRQIKRDAFDFYIAGAGLAAHLPGVIASHTQRPVFGIPVNGALGGLDALLSIVQMPAGVPVLASGVEQIEAVVSFLSARPSSRDHLHVTCPDSICETSDFKRELERSALLAAELGVKLTHGGHPLPDAINIICVDVLSGSQPSLDAGAILVPWLDADHKGLEMSSLGLAKAMLRGGVWVGVNNLRNGILSGNRMGQLQRPDQLIYRGSVKDVLGSADHQNLIFEYSDRYSVFDWGAMPDEIPGKGEALATIADQIFRNIDIPHHSLGLMPGRPRCLSVKKVDVKWPTKEKSGWNYSSYASKPLDCLVPLEVIFRFGIPLGSSLPTRLRANPEYMAALGLNQVPEMGAEFAVPLIEFSTKLEDSDRYLLPEEARRISGMTVEELKKLKKMAAELAEALRRFFGGADLKLWDGKFEFSFTAGDETRNFMLVDSVGPDELRLTHDGVQISKEILRQFYVDGPWHSAVGRAKELAAQKPELDWRALCAEDLGQRPQRLTPEVCRIAQNIYPAVANSLARVKGDRPPFPAAWDLSHLVARVREQGLA